LQWQRYIKLHINFNLYQFNFKGSSTSETTPKKKRGRPSGPSKGLQRAKKEKIETRPSGPSKGLQMAKKQKIENVRLRLHFGTFLEMFA